MSWALVALLVIGVMNEPAAEPGAARAAYWAGRAAKGKDRRASFQRGMEAAQAMLDKNPDDSEGLLWMAANMGAEALERGKLQALPIIPKMVELLDRLDRVDPKYENAAAARTLAHLYFVAPPIISVGSDDKAKVKFERALELAPDFPGNLALAANFFDDQGDDERALELAQRALLTLPHYFKDPEAKEWRKIAERIVEDNG